MTDADAGSSPSEPEQIARAALAVQGVVALSAGPLGQFRSYLPGGHSVPGVRVEDDSIVVNVIGRYGEPLAGLGAALAQGLGDLRAGRSVTVEVDDILTPGEPEPTPPASLVETTPPAVAAAVEPGDPA